MTPSPPRTKNSAKKAVCLIFCYIIFFSVGIVFLYLFSRSERLAKINIGCPSHTRRSGEDDTRAVVGETADRLSSDDRIVSIQPGIVMCNLIHEYPAESRAAAPIHYERGLPRRCLPSPLPQAVFEGCTTTSRNPTSFPSSI